LLGRERKLIFRIASKPIRTVLWWQITATVALTAIAGSLTGFHGAVSAALGGLVSICGGLGFAAVASFCKAESTWGALFLALRAEAVKIAVLVFLMWLVLANYPSVVVLAFVGAFAVSVLLFGMAFFVRDT
jgi:ATP synthase protein I